MKNLKHYVGNLSCAFNKMSAPAAEGMDGGKRSAWMSHVKRTMKANKGKSLMEVLKMAKKTYKKTGGGIASGALPLTGARRSRRRRGGEEGDEEEASASSSPYKTVDGTATGKPSAMPDPSTRERGVKFPPPPPRGGRKTRKTGRKGGKRTRKH